MQGYQAQEKLYRHHQEQHGLQSGKGLQRELLKALECKEPDMSAPFTHFGEIRMQHARSDWQVTHPAGTEGLD